MAASAAPQSVEQLLAHTVSFNTVNGNFGGPTGGEERLATSLEELAKDWGFATRRCPVPGHGFNLLISLEVDPKAEWLLFESHLDTVSVEGMTVPPWELTVVGDRLHGRGACDTKGSGAAMFWALREYARGANRPRNVGVLFVVDEETGMSGAEAFAAAELREFLPLLKGLVVGEPTGLRPVVAHNGVFRWRTITRGVAVHSADPSKGRSAIRAMLPVVAALEEKFVPLANRVDPIAGKSAASINIIRGGAAANIIPDQCEIVVDRRLVAGETPDLVRAQRDAALAGLEVEHDDEYFAPPMGSTGLGFHAWMKPVLEALGHDAAPAGAPYATDGGHYASAGAPVIVIGPGHLAQAHTKDEWISRAQLQAATDFYLRLMTTPS